MAGRRAVRLELVVGLILIAFKIRNPVAAVVLGDPPVVAGCPSQDVVYDPSRADPELLIACHVGRCKESLHGVHVGVEAAIAVKLREFRVPCIAGEALFLIPEALVIECDRLIEQFPRAGTSRQYSTGRCQDHKGMGITRLAGQNTVVRSASAVPSAVHSVMKLAAQSFKGRVSQFFTSGMA